MNSPESNEDSVPDLYEQVKRRALATLVIAHTRIHDAWDLCEDHGETMVLEDVMSTIHDAGNDLSNLIVGPEQD